MKDMPILKDIQLTKIDSKSKRSNKRKNLHLVYIKMKNVKN